MLDGRKSIELDLNVYALRVSFLIGTLFVTIGEQYRWANCTRWGYNVLTLGSNSTRTDHRVLSTKDKKRKAPSPKLHKAKEPAIRNSSREESSDVGSCGNNDDDENSYDCESSVFSVASD